MLQEGILSAVGSTPLVRLNRLLPDSGLRLYAKLEALNPGGSIKDRPAIGIIRRALQDGIAKRGTVVVESSSGNMGVGLAMACSYFGLRFICVVDPKTTTQNIRLMQAYGAEVDMVVDPHPVAGEYLQARIDRVRDLLAATPGSFWPNQYSNPENASAHHQTMAEIEQALNAAPDYLLVATSTCGTLRGCVEYVREHNCRTSVIAVDAAGSVIFGGQRSKRLIPGHGAAVSPPLYVRGLEDRVEIVTDLDCVVGCRRLARMEAILAGGSSGAVVAALGRIHRSLSPASTCVLVFADRGERYLDTIYSDTWVHAHLGDIDDAYNSFARSEICAHVAAT